MRATTTTRTPPVFQRRGSALLIVIGTLALVSVFAAIYISIGQSDARVARSVEGRRDTEQVKNAIGEHAARIIALDRLDTTVSHPDDSDAISLVREGVDLPYTDWFMRSSSQEPWRLFNPTGRHTLAGPVADEDYRVASDPWLAATEPTFLGDPGQPIHGNDLRPFASLIPDNASTNDPGTLPRFVSGHYSSDFLDWRDWSQISNIAPDGRFVNLFNLRPNEAFNDGTIGGFNAEPGFGTTDLDARDVRRMSEYLSLVRPQLGNASSPDPTSALRAFDPGEEGIWIPGRNEPTTAHGITDDLANVPAVWTMYQRYMFMPLNQPFEFFNREGELSTWADPDFPLYQYADADGDGMADSRWFELTSARDPDADTSTQTRTDIARIVDAQGSRVFAAARIVDLSSMVNINTASDLLAEPNPREGAPLGATPADIDLRRVLTMEDPAGSYAFRNNLGLSGRDIHRPRDTRGRDYADQDTLFFDAWYEPETLSSGLERRELRPSAVTSVVGALAYDAIKREQIGLSAIDADALGWPPELFITGDTLDQAELDFDTVYNPPELPDGAPTDPESLGITRLKLWSQEFAETALTRRESYNTYGVLDPFNPPILTEGQSPISVETQALFDEVDLAELLTFHALNDPETFSRLERAATGRMPSINGFNHRSYSPLFTNRTLDFDRARHGESDDEDLYTVLAPSEPREINGRIAKESMAYFALSPRRVLTTVSGAAPILPDATVSPIANSLAGQGKPTLSGAITSPDALFGVYRGALVGELDGIRTLLPSINDLFPDDVTLFRSSAASSSFATLFYGHTAPELSLRIAAHAAVNMADLSDPDTIPSVRTLLLDREREDDIGDADETGNFPEDPEDINPDNSFYRDYPGRASGPLLDPELDTTLTDELPNNTLDSHRRAVNVFGIEPMPVLTEVTSFYVFQDVSEEADGDTDYRQLRPRVRAGFPTLIPVAGTMPNITIDGDPDPVTNPDCLMEGIAFQLHNPWDTTISLGGSQIKHADGGLTEGDPLTRHRVENDPDRIDANANYQFEYYIEWNGYFFKLAQYQQYYPPSSSDEFPERVFRDRDQEIVGVTNPLSEFGPNDGDDTTPTTDNGGHLVPSTYPDFVARNVTLDPGETRVFFAIADPSFDPANAELELDRKWRDAFDAYDDVPSNYQTGGADLDMDTLPDGLDGRGWTGMAFEWVVRQLNHAGIGGMERAVMVHPMNPQTGEYLSEVPRDLLGAPLDHGSFDQLSGATGRQDAGEVRLWRKIVTPGEEEATSDAFNNNEPENLLHNDLLVDRMTLESGLAVPLDADHEVPLSAGFPEDYPLTSDEIDANVRNDNTGYTIVKWATTGRRDSTTLDAPGIGQVREWSMSSRANPTGSVTFAVDPFGPDPDNNDFLGSGDFDDVTLPGEVTSDRETHLDPGQFLAETLNPSERVLVSIGLPPYLKSDLDAFVAANGEGSAIKFARDGGALWDHPDGFTLHAIDDFSDTNLRPELLTNAAGFNGAPRLADLLLAWGIGPTFAPGESSGSLDDLGASYYSEEWMTLPEAIAIALGYEDPLATGESADNIWSGTFSTTEQILDNGRLRIDDYVSYLNQATEDPPEFDVGIDIRRGTGVPMALGVVDRLRAVAPFDPSADPVTSPTYGLVNINTAPVRVLRALPGLSPSIAEYYRDNAVAVAQRQLWNDLDLEALNIYDLQSPRATPDVAATIAGYRDRTMVRPRGASMDLVVGSSDSYELNPINYAPAGPDDNNALDNTAAVAFNLMTEVPVVAPSSDDDHRDRQTLSGIDALRPSPGFGTLGEILAVTLDESARGAGHAPGSPANLRSLFPQLDIQMLARDELVLDGDPDDVVALDPQLFGGSVNGATADDYAERLALANGVLNTISVRSDFFAVWFVMHVYRPKDVEGLLPQDPLIPSVAKRYLMVVDRSRVVTEDDEPRIVLFKEVPM